MSCCANKLNALCYRLSKVAKDLDLLKQSVGPWSYWYSMYLALMVQQRVSSTEVSRDSFPQGLVLVGVTDPLLVMTLEYLTVKLTAGPTLYLFTDLAMLPKIPPFVAEELVIVDAYDISKIVELWSGGGMKVTGSLSKECTGLACGTKAGELYARLKRNSVSTVKDGNRSLDDEARTANGEENKDKDKDEDVCDEPHEPFESSEPLETEDFTTTTDDDGRTVQAVEERLRQILDVTESGSEVTDS